MDIKKKFFYLNLIFNKPLSILYYYRFKFQINKTIKIIR